MASCHAAPKDAKGDNGSLECYLEPLIGLGVYAFLVVWLTNLFALALFGTGLGAVACVLHAALHDPPETFEAS